MEKSAKKQENSVLKWFKDTGKGFVTFIRESRAELRKVQWPNRKETVTYTTIVVVASLGLSFFIWIIDQGLGLLLRWFMA
ncbi:MAG: preprotein translocase subunit SecE [Symbiobacteriaceae bacterium]|nr:preprotein translocase subunit SecE [Symbiobacteriaceae bacterium]